MIYFDQDYPQEKLIKISANILREGGIAVYPTDTVYGIGCDLHQRSSIEKIYRMKNFKKSKPLSFICSNLIQVSKYAQISNLAYKIMKKLLPGPYTFILKATKMVPKIVISNQKTVGIRVPDNEICLSLVKELGNPIINTSASWSEEEVLIEPAIILEHFEPFIDAVIDQGKLI
ncbi:MAG: threonylcarbamoyl-AMP synthase, partial [Armatimonadetes bacterium]|nr:threonylcarbamoyl-AMP synthase [Armatimonadota bacterium]